MVARNPPSSSLTDNSIAGLTLEQQYEVQALTNHVKTLSSEELQTFVVEMYTKQLMMTNLFHHFMYNG